MLVPGAVCSEPGVAAEPVRTRSRVGRHGHPLRASATDRYLIATPAADARQRAEAAGVAGILEWNGWRVLLFRYWRLALAAGRGGDFPSSVRSGSGCQA
jgi:hypothetical protein